MKLANLRFRQHRIERGWLTGLLLIAAVAVAARTQAGEPWAPPPPPPDDFDWVQLKSGEWLKGRIKGVQERELEFDSEELDDLTFDIEDVAVIRSGRTVSVSSDDRTTVDGIVSLGEEMVVVTNPQTGAETIRYPRGQLLGIAPAGDREIDHWSAKVSLGLNALSGNTRSTDVVATAVLERRTPNTRGKIDYRGNFGKIESIETVNNHRANITFDVFRGRRFFFRPVQWEYFRDLFQNISSRSTIGVSAGYYFYDRPDFEWLVTGGPAYQKTRFESVGVGEDPTSKSPSALFTSHFDKELTSRIDLIFSYNLTFTEREGGRLIHHSVNTLEIELTRTLDLDLTLTWDRVAEPQAGFDGIVPKKDDFRLGVSFGLDM